jgi:adenosylmethionine-8-amino-7-oxononanoate aminotransferase
VFECFLSNDPHAALMHGPTYMANPLACAAANASLDLFEIEPRLAQVETIAQVLRDGLEPCKGLPGVVDVRVKGAIGVVQLEKIEDMHALRQDFIKRGTWVRVFGDIIYLTPAFTIDAKELAALTRAVCDVVGEYGQASAEKRQAG